MSSTDGKKESFLASTREKSSPEELHGYRFDWIRRLVDRLFPARAPNFGNLHGGTLRTRK